MSLTLDNVKHKYQLFFELLLLEIQFREVIVHIYTITNRP